VSVVLRPLKKDKEKIEKNPSCILRACRDIHQLGWMYFISLNPVLGELQKKIRKK
jgi:hypothetical protein